MSAKLNKLFSSAAMMLCMFSPTSSAQDQTTQLSGQIPIQDPLTGAQFPLQLRSWSKPALTGDKFQSMMGAISANTVQTLPLTAFSIYSTRDGNLYRGALVGQDPFNGGRTTNVPTKIVPVVLKTHTIGVSFNSQGIISTQPGVTVSDPSVADTACLGSTNNVPLTLLKQSPLFKPATFDFGGTVVGTTQYIDAFQRGQFWQVADRNNYHLLLAPVTTTDPVYLDVPADKGLALAASVIGACGPMTIIDINWFDSLLDYVIIPALAAQGVTPSTFPIFLVHNSVWGSVPLTNLRNCCYGGYHSYSGFPVPIQTYSPSNWDSLGIFGTAGKDTGILSHEIGEWANDPFVINQTPLWGHIGQVGFCQGNLEVGDPLTGTQAPPIAMPNGFTYHLQELAFFSWFFGQPSVGVHHWFSNNGTFLTDAGPPCH